MPLEVLQSLLLPFFFHNGITTAFCQSSGTLPSSHALRKIVVSQVISVSPLARMVSVVIPSIPAAFPLGLVLMAFLTSLSRMVGSERCWWLGMNWDWVSNIPDGFRRSWKYSSYLCRISSPSCRGWSICVVNDCGGVKGSFSYPHGFNTSVEHSRRVFAYFT